MNLKKVADVLEDLAKAQKIGETETNLNVLQRLLKKEKSERDSVKATKLGIIDIEKRLTAKWVPIKRVKKLCASCYEMMRESGLKKISAQLLANNIPGGLADLIPPEHFDTKDLQKGTKVEMEHTSDPEISQEIATDHLSEDKDYYDKLEKMEKTGKMRGPVKNEIQLLEKKLATKWKGMPGGWDEPESRRKWWNTAVGDVEHKRTKCHDKIMSWIKDDERAWKYCQSLWDEFEK